MRRQFWEGRRVQDIAKDFGISYCYCWQVCNFYRLKGEAPPDFRPRSRFYDPYASGRSQVGCDSPDAGGLNSVRMAPSEREAEVGSQVPSPTQ